MWKHPNSPKGFQIKTLSSLMFCPVHFVLFDFAPDKYCNSGQCFSLPFPHSSILCLCVFWFIFDMYLMLYLSISHIAHVLSIRCRHLTPKFKHWGIPLSSLPWCKYIWWPFSWLNTPKLCYFERFHSWNLAILNGRITLTTILNYDFWYFEGLKSQKPKN